MIKDELSDNLKDIKKTLEKKYKKDILKTKVFRGELTFVIKEDVIRQLLEYCHSNLDFNFLTDISSVDNWGEFPRFEIVYELYSFKSKANLRIKIQVGEGKEVPTVCDIWQTANWHEREIYDMMGIKFKNHPNLTRILMWEGFGHNPLLKDFPLEGVDTKVKEVAFSSVAPIQGGHFTSKSGKNVSQREPRAK